MASTILADNGVSSGSAGIKTSADSTGVLALQTTTAGGAATTAVTIDTSQNVGVGVTPSAWGSYNGALDLKGGGALGAFNNSTALFSNSYYNGTNYIYKASTSAAFYQMAGNVHQWYTAPSGTAGATATFTQAMTLDASGNWLLGTTSSPSYGRTTAKIFNATGGLFEVSSTSVTGLIYSYETSGTFNVGTNSAHPLILNTSGTERARIDTSGRFLITAEGASTTFTSPGQLAIKRSGGSPYMSFHGDSGSRIGFIQMQSGGHASIWTENAQPLTFGTDGVERARIDSSGNLLVGITSRSVHSIQKSVTDGTAFCEIGTIGSTGNNTLIINSCGSSGVSTANAGLWVQKTNNGRSINAAGTINASGADYAEYMVKAGDFTVAKGDVVGINAEGKLTNVFTDAVSFAVKSTDPSYVGGDVWGREEEIGLARPVQPTDDATDETKAQYEADKSAFDSALETARQTVDRIAFAGQVPVNVTGATAGQFIVPVEDNGAIKGIAVNEADMTLSQYMKAVGKVIAIEQDGRARIIVKVA